MLFVSQGIIVIFFGALNSTFVGFPNKALALTVHAHILGGQCSIQRSFLLCQANSLFLCIIGLVQLINLILQRINPRLVTVLQFVIGFFQFFDPLLNYPVGTIDGGIQVVFVLLQLLFQVIPLVFQPVNFFVNAVGYSLNNAIQNRLLFFQFLNNLFNGLFLVFQHLFLCFIGFFQRLGLLVQCVNRRTLGICGTFVTALAGFRLGTVKAAKTIAIHYGQTLFKIFKLFLSIFSFGFLFF